MPTKTRAKNKTQNQSKTAEKGGTTSTLSQRKQNGSDDEFQAESLSQIHTRKRDLASRANRKHTTRCQRKNGLEREHSDAPDNVLKPEEEEGALFEEAQSPASKLRKMADSSHGAKDSKKASVHTNDNGVPKQTKGKNCRKRKEILSPYFSDEKESKRTQNSDDSTQAKSKTVKPKGVGKRKPNEMGSDSNMKSAPAKVKRPASAKVKRSAPAEVESSPQAKVERFVENETSNCKEPDVKLEEEQSCPSTSHERMDEDSDSSDSCWEEVEDLPQESSPKKEIPVPNAIQFTVQNEDGSKRKKKTKAEKIQEYFKREFNRLKKENRENMHKVHLLCLVAHGLHLQKVCTSQLLIAQALSIIPEEFTGKPIRRYDVVAVGGVMNWFQKTVVLDTSVKQKEEMKSLDLLSGSFERKVATSQTDYVCMLFVVMVTLGLDVRLILSLQPVPFKEPSKKETKQTKTVKSAKPNSAKNKTDKSKEPKIRGSKKVSKECADGNPRTKNRLSRQCASKVSPVIDASGSSAEEDEETHGGRKGKQNEKRKKNVKNTSIRNARVSTSERSSDSDFEPETLSPRSSQSTRKMSSPNSSKQLNSPKSEPTNSVEKKLEINDWLEVFLPAEKKWTCIDCINGTVDKSDAMETVATQPLSYVLGFDNDGCVKDLTSKYAARWMYSTRKLRIDQEWWTDTLNAYKTKKRKRDKEEDSAIKSRLLSQPFPTSIADFKNHPLYALKRHLLKFECIYPDSAVPLGFIKSEPIYARECVHELHSRETWLKEARTVRIGEKAYKMVKPRPKPHKPHENTGEATLELYGEWQTVDYIPPVAVDGKVPRNEYGNVEMFKPCMLPIGTVHLQIQGLNKVARKIGIDCAPAMVGWDFHSGYCHAVIDGYIVCEENKDTLLAAWEEEQQIVEQKEAQKREKRVLANWTTLVRGLMIRERLERKYNLQRKPEVVSPEDSEKATDVDVSWPRNRQTSSEVKQKGRGEKAGHLFPFEKM